VAHRVSASIALLNFIQVSFFCLCVPSLAA
jgi:hypothetical protein